MRHIIYFFSLPFAAGQLSVTSSVTATTFTVTWQNYNAYLYKVAITEVSGKPSSPVTLPPTANEYTFTNLKPHMDYTVTVTPIALDGKTLPAATASLKTKDAGNGFSL